MISRLKIGSIKDYKKITKQMKNMFKIKLIIEIKSKN